MPSDPRRLRPSELCRLVNSTPLGAVLTERLIFTHRTLAGYRIGDDKRVDLLRYAAWLARAHDEPRQPPADPYARLKDQARARNVAIAQAGRDIGELPAVVNPDRKARAARDFRYFCEAYFP